MFRRQLDLQQIEEQAARDVSLFVCLVYVRSWFRAPDIIDAPTNDITFLKDICEYRLINNDIAQVAFAAMSRHLWYLSEELVALALFSSSIGPEDKRQMLVSMATNCGSQRCETRRPRISISDASDLTLPQLFTNNTSRFFETLRLPTSFLQVDPECWEDRSDFQAAKECLKAFRVVSDIAERAIKLMEDFNSAVTIDEEQKQFLLQVVANHRRQRPKPTKFYTSQKLDD